MTTLEERRMIWFGLIRQNDSTGGLCPPFFISVCINKIRAKFPLE